MVKRLQDYVTGLVVLTYCYYTVLFFKSIKNTLVCTFANIILCIFMGVRLHLSFSAPSEQ